MGRRVILRTGSVAALAVTVSGRRLAKAGESLKQTTCDLQPKVINTLSVNTNTIIHKYAPGRWAWDNSVKGRSLTTTAEKDETKEGDGNLLGLVMVDGFMPVLTSLVSQFD